MLSDAQWSLIEDLLPRPTGRPGRKFSDARLMVEVSATLENWSVSRFKSEQLRAV